MQAMISVGECVGICDQRRYGAAIVDTASPAQPVSPSAKPAATKDVIATATKSGTNFQKTPQAITALSCT